MPAQETLHPTVEWIIQQHRDTNHRYDSIIPYEFHLKMVASIGQEYLHLVPMEFANNVYHALWGHDLIEDTRLSYNDVEQVLGLTTAEIIYAVTNNKGRNRAERANDEYYKGIRENGLAVFVKLCDRIANVDYSMLTKSKMVGVYGRENNDFVTKLGYREDHVYEPLFRELIKRFA